MLSVALIVFSYLSNVWLAGLIVLITHDGSDALLLIARFYKVFIPFKILFRIINIQLLFFQIFWEQSQFYLGYFLEEYGLFII
jgi:hypothetical protein